MRHTSKVWPQTDVITFQEFVHSFFDEGHVPWLIDTEKQSSRSCECLKTQTRTTAGFLRAHLSAQRITARSSGSVAAVRSHAAASRMSALHCPDS